MENKNELGHIYGSRISKNGKWLNLTIAAEINGEKHFITCSVKIKEDYDDIVGTDKPYARLEMLHDSEGNPTIDKAFIGNLPVYEDSKPKQEEPKQEEPADDIPF